MKPVSDICIGNRHALHVIISTRPSIALKLTVVNFSDGLHYFHFSMQSASLKRKSLTFFKFWSEPATSHIQREHSSNLALKTTQIEYTFKNMPLITYIYSI